MKRAAFALILALLAATPVLADDPELDLQETVYQAATDCTKEGGNPVDCFVKASPSRCAAQAAGMVSNRGMWQRDWLLCVRSCAGASWWNKTVGDCRR